MILVVDQDEDEDDRYFEIALSRACWTEASESLCRRVERKWALGLQTFILKRIIMMLVMLIVGAKAEVFVNVLNASVWWDCRGEKFHPRWM